MSAIMAFFYGLIQGITEFLPISSSGHLALIPHFFEIKDPGVFFDLLMHLGTALAVIVYFHKDLFKMFKDSAPLFKGKRNHPQSFYVQNYIIATVSSVIVILMVKDLAFSYGRNANIIALNLIVFGILLALSDRSSGESKDLTQKRDLKKAITIGVAQALAAFPGVSRSGITITAARFMGVSRENAGRFSFLLSLPIILAGIIYKLPALLKGAVITESLAVIIIGVLSSFIIGLLSIHFFLGLINRFGLWVYGAYRVLLAALILLL